MLETFHKYPTCRYQLRCWKIKSPNWLKHDWSEMQSIQLREMCIYDCPGFKMEVCTLTKKYAFPTFNANCWMMGFLTRLDKNDDWLFYLPTYKIWWRPYMTVYALWLTRLPYLPYINNVSCRLHLCVIDMLYICWTVCTNFLCYNFQVQRIWAKRNQTFVNINFFFSD